jgi:hypothetical protein
LVPRPNANYQMTSGYWKQLNLQMWISQIYWQREWSPCWSKVADYRLFTSLGYIQYKSPHILKILPIRLLYVRTSKFIFQVDDCIH